jgi:hypothetical protein
MNIYVCIDEGMVVGVFSNIENAKKYRKKSFNEYNPLFHIKCFKLNEGVIDESN